MAASTRKLIQPCWRPVALVLSGALTTHPAICAAASAPSGDLSAQIRESLVDHGEIDSLESSLPVPTPRNVHSLQDRVQFELEQGRLAAALPYLQQLVSLDPKNVPVLVQLADVQDLLGEADAAAQTMQSALTEPQSPADRTLLQLKLAALQLDNRHAAAGVATLDSCVAADPAAAQQAGIVAALLGQSAAAARYLRGTTPSDVDLKILEGNAELDSSDPAHAAAAFSWALDHAVDPSDRSYLYERLIATARETKTLPALAKTWLTRTDPPADQIYPLATVLRELGQVDNLLNLWRQSATNPKYSAVAMSPRFVSEVISAAQTAGQADKAAAVCREMLARDPDNPEWLMTTVRILLQDGKPADADALLTAQLQKFRQSPDDLQRIGRSALAVGRFEVTLQAGQDLAEMGNGNAVSGQLLQADACLRSGDRSRGEALLKQAADTVAKHSLPFAEVASALENAGLIHEEITFLKAFVAQQKNPDAAQWLAELLVKQDKPLEAVSLLDDLRNSADTPALRAQASRRLLVISSQAHQLDQLIQRLQLQASSPRATEDDLALLIDAHVMANQPEAAADLIRKTTFYGPTEKLHRLYMLYLRTQLYDQADAVLHQLLIAEPENAIETLEQMATISLQRNKSDEAEAAMRQIEKRVGGSGDSSMEFLGDFYDRVGRPSEAATYYRRAIAVHPENAENWLLWATECKKAGQKDRAGERLQLLCLQAGDDNTFAVGADGLLNLNMPPEALRAARRQAVLRVASSPRSMILYHVIADLSEELKDASFETRAVQASLPQSRDERPQQLRQLMESASQTGAVDAAVSAGRSLIAIGDEFPPALFMDLAEQLLRVNRLDEADRALQRAVDVSGSEDNIISRAATLYQKYGFADRALATLNPLIDRLHADSAFCEQLAQLHDLIGRHDLSFEEYLTALKSTIDATAQAAAPKQSGGVISNGPGVHVMSMSSGPAVPPEVARTLNGATVQARTPEQQKRLMDLLCDRLKSMEQAGQSDSVPSPSLIWLSSLLRSTCFALHQPEVADQTDRELLKRWPGNQSLKQSFISQRMEHGLYSRAAQFAVELHLPVPATALAVRQLETTSPPVTEPTQIAVEDAVKILPGLVAGGQFDQARQVIHALPGDLSPRQISALPVLTAAASAVGDQDALLRWTLHRIDLTVATIVARPTVSRSIGKPPLPGTTAPQAPSSAHRPLKSVSPVSSSLTMSSYLLRNAVTGTWPELSKDGQLAVLASLHEMAIHYANPAVRSDAAILSLALGTDDAGNGPGRTGLVQQVSVDATANVSKQCQLFAFLPDADRPAFIQNSLHRLPPNSWLPFVLHLVAQTTEPIDAATGAALVNAVESISVTQTDEWCPWFSNQAQSAIICGLAKAMVKVGDAGLLSDDPAPLVAAAIALANGGDSTDADITAAAAIRKYLAHPGAQYTQTNAPSQTEIIRFAANAMSSGGRAALLRELEHANQADVEKALLLQADGRSVDALDLLRASFVNNPDDSDAAWLYVQALSADGRLEEIADQFSPRLLAGKFGDDDSKIRKTVADALQQLHRDSQARKILEGDEEHGELSHDELLLNSTGGDSQKLSQYVRLHLQQWERTPPALLAPEIADKWSGCAGSFEDLLAVIRAAAPMGSPATDQRLGGWADVLVQNARKGNRIDSLIEALSQAEASASLNKTDRLILRSLAMLPGISLPLPLKDELWRSSVAAESPAIGEYFAPSLGAQQDSRAASTETWAAALAQTTDSHSVIAPFISLLDPLTDATGAVQIKAMIDAGHTDEAERQLRGYRILGHITPQYLGCGLLWARCAAEQGQVKAFTERLAQVLSTERWGSAYDYSASRDSSAPDLKLALPSRVLDPAARSDLFNSVLNLLTAQSTQWPIRSDQIQLLTQLGDWAVEQNDDAAKQRVLSAVAAILHKNSDAHQ